MTKKKLNTLKKAFDHKDKMSQRQAARKYGMSQQMVSKILKKRGIKARKKMKIPKRTETKKIEERIKCGNLYLKKSLFTGY